MPGYVRLAINKVRKSLGIGQLGKLIAYTSVEQEHAWENLGITISQVIKENAAGSANDLDLLFSGRKTMSGVPIKSSINADQTRVDFLDLSHWGRAVMKDIDFFEIGGQTVFPIYGASGGISAAFIFYFDTGFQVWNDSPRSGATSTRWLARPATRARLVEARKGPIGGALSRRQPHLGFPQPKSASLLPAGKRSPYQGDIRQRREVWAFFSRSLTSPERSRTTTQTRLVK